MSREVDSGALTFINRALGIAGVGSPRTELIDGDINQTVEIANVARRAAPGTGQFWGLHQTAHGAGATSLSATISPYGPDLPNGNTCAVAPYPNPVPSKFDLFLIGASVHLSAVANYIAGSIQLNVPATNKGFGIQNNEGVFAAVNPASTVFVADFPATAGGLQGVMAVTGTGQVWLPLRFRVRRGTTITFSTDAGGAITITLNTLWSLQPICFGQNVAV